VKPFVDRLEAGKKWARELGGARSIRIGIAIF
jgi:hypothetical protein